MKKFISIILSAIIVFSIFTIGVSAEGATSGKCGDNLTWNFNKTTGVLTISGTGYMYNYDYNNEPPFDESPWRDYVYDIKKVIISKGVKSIGNSAFDGDGEGMYVNLSEVELPDGLEKIGKDSFNWCYNLDSIVIPDSVTVIGSYAFYECESLESVTLPESLTRIEDYVFYACPIKDIQIPPNVTSIGSAAFTGYSFTDIEIPASVIYIDNDAFGPVVYYDSNLENIEVASDNTTYSSDKNGVLFNKEKTELLIYPIANERTEYVIPQGVITINTESFEYCGHFADETDFKKLTKLSIPLSVKKIEDYAFYYSTSITDIYYEGSEADWEAIQIGSGCEHLTNVTIHYNSNHWDVTNTPDEENIFSLSTILEIIAEAFVIIAEICTKALEFIINSITYIIN